MRRYIVLWAVLLSGIGCREHSSSTDRNSTKLFKALTEQESGISFQNSVTPSSKLSISNYPYFYNGGGVAAGDIDNDGLADLFFTANQGSDRLYLNQGSLRFQDISQLAGIEESGTWSTGAAMADVNGDGWLDIYVTCVSGYQQLEGHNLLYINNKNQTFTESSQQYGLDQVGYGTQTVFFDFDHDGDLDCYQLNHAVHDASSFQSLSTKGKTSTEGDKLFRNDQGRFTDVTTTSGILQLYNGFGLGISIADVNGDHWEDIYIANDFHEDDLLYINNRNGSFTESAKTYLRHTSRFSMGVDAVDFNNDGHIDITTLDMTPPDEKIAKSTVGEDPNLVYYYKKSFGYMDQYNRNCLQLNREGKGFSEIGSLAGITTTDWSWSPLWADYDMDGDKDLFVSNGIPKRPNDLDFIDFMYNKSQQGGSDPQVQSPRLNFLQSMEKMPEGDSHNFYFKNMGTYLLEDASAEAGFEIPDCANGAAYADLDNDGDLEIILNRLNTPSIIYQNLGQENKSSNYLRISLRGEGLNTFGIGTKVTAYQKDAKQLYQQSPTKGFMSSVDPTLLIGFSDLSPVVDSIIVRWASGKIQKLFNVQTPNDLVINESEAKFSNVKIPLQSPLFQNLPNHIPFTHRENSFIDFSRDALLPFLTSMEGPAIAKGDFNGDGMEDVFIGGARGQTSNLWIQQQNGQFDQVTPLSFVKDSAYEDVDGLFLDVDLDNDLDLYVVSGGNELNNPTDRLYINNGNSSYLTKTLLPPIRGNKSCVRSSDFDQDGDQDLFIGGRNIAGAYGLPARSYLLKNDGEGNFNEISGEFPDLSTPGMVTDATWIDIDNDQDDDLIIVGEWMKVLIFENEGGILRSRPNLFGPEMSGLWQSIEKADFDNDGDQDLILGNLGLNTNLIKERGTSLRLYVCDFDGNNKQEQIIAYQRSGQWYPAILKKDELGAVIPGIINKRFTSHKAFAGKSMDQIFSDQEIAKSNILEVQTLESVYLENTGNFKFIAHKLPLDIQLSTINSILVLDVNSDNNLDVVLGGNNFGAHSYQGRYDASYGHVLLGNGDGTFKVLESSASGIFISGQIRGIELLSINSVPHLIIARNNDRVLSYSINTNEL